MTLEEKQEFMKQYIGQTISTVYGPSVVEELSDDGENVFLLEMGEEPYALSFEDFLTQL